MAAPSVARKKVKKFCLLKICFRHYRSIFKKKWRKKFSPEKWPKKTKPPGGGVRGGFGQRPGFFRIFFATFPNSSEMLIIHSADDVAKVIKRENQPHSWRHSALQGKNWRSQQELMRQSQMLYNSGSHGGPFSKVVSCIEIAKNTQTLKIADFTM